jgi:hypothetical protein
MSQNATIVASAISHVDDGLSVDATGVLIATSHR